jgi:hypothetical protein
MFESLCGRRNVTIGYNYLSAGSASGRPLRFPRHVEYTQQNLRRALHVVC